VLSAGTLFKGLEPKKWITSIRETVALTLDLKNYPTREFFAHREAPEYMPEK